MLRNNVRGSERQGRSLLPAFEEQLAYKGKVPTLKRAAGQRRLWEELFLHIERILAEEPVGTGF